MTYSLPKSRLEAGAIFALQRQDHPPDARMHSHLHPEGQLFGITEGLLIVTTGAGSWMTLPGQIGWIPPDMPHSARVHGTMTGWTAYIHRDLCKPLQVPAVYRMTDLSGAVLGRLLEGDGLAIGSDRQNRLVAVLIDEVASLAPQPMYLPMPRREPLVTMAVAIAANPSSTRSIDDLARAAGLSRRSLTRRFRAETGMSIVAWRHAARMQRGLELLMTGKSVTTTAHELGYDSASRFIELFRRIFGATPKQFLKQPDL